MIETKICKWCGKEFEKVGKQQFCSEECRSESRRECSKRHKREYRQKKKLKAMQNKDAGLNAKVEEASRRGISYGQLVAKEYMAQSRISLEELVDQVKKVIYISGKVTGDKNYKAKFKEAEEKIKKRYPAAEIVNPTAAGFPDTYDWADCMRECMHMLKKCNAIYFLDDWQESAGACIERATALRLELEKIEEGA